MREPDNYDSYNFGCIDCLSWRLEKFSQLLHVSSDIILDAHILEDKLNTVPVDFPCAITGVEDDTPVIVLPAAGCEKCVNRAAHRSPRIPKLIPLVNDAHSRFTSDQDFRTQSDEEFLTHTSLLFGILGIATVLVKQAHSVVGSEFYNSVQFLTPDNQFDVAGGKGDTPIRAQASCVGEAIERYFLSGIYAKNNVIGTYKELKDLNPVDPLQEWGFPVNDTHPFISPYTQDSRISWTTTSRVFLDNEILNEQETIIPSDVIFLPSDSGQAFTNISVNSTNGTASGANFHDAVMQSCFELIERDAYWFYMRTTVKPVEIPQDFHTPHMREIMEMNPELSYTCELLPTPFNIPVVQVLVQAESSGIVSRGTGAHYTLHAAMNRAFNECNQMLVSLRTGNDVEQTPLQMRNIWYSGQAPRIFPNIFNPSKNFHDTYNTLWNNQNALTLNEMVQLFEKQRLHLYVKTLCETNAFTVVKSSATRIGIEDPTYYRKSARLAEFASRLGEKLELSTYQSTLFM